ncbi:hypothetical protein [Pseudomonas agarici]|uniref:hypothetical protein n=1 Tax=Pseudomonas agarici TaxID=46677 RepID=UPI0002E774CF|nr:hypothetical protein [Pseudomonas agarici]NWB93165.1 hypothetical protein [Pseudomonas agarici]NWC08461.1 hypothetical protein [Pseudomonas agarici]SEK67630.1 hypothetical protein SAMN05216604_105139 [Pseudomonas agarici]
MSTRNWPRHLLCLSLGLPLGSALACGPDFPLRLLDDRAQSLAELPETNFAFEVSRLGQAMAGLKTATDATLQPSWDSDDNTRPYREQRDKVEATELPENLRAKVAQLRALQDPQQVEALGRELPDELRLYIAGAVAFDIGNQALAAQYFRKVLALPADQRGLRSTWAAYSLGRALVALSIEASVDPQVISAALRAQARLAFQQARQLSAEDFSDPLELGIASLGEEARLAKLNGDWESAVQLYASQSRLGAGTGYSSLKQVARELVALADEQLLEQLKYPTVQKLFTAYLLSRVGWFFDEQPAQEQRLTRLLLASVTASFDNADRLAALSYQKGDFVAARAYLDHAGDGGLAWWVRAKLALRDGDKLQAAAAYAKAAEAFPKDEVWGPRRNADGAWENVQPGCRVEGESAILALDRGDYLQAFDQLYRSQDIYWPDAATVAERVLTLDELKIYVDTQVAAPPLAKAQDRDNYVLRPIAAQLRELLGRRLLREGRYDEAPAYFESPELQAAAHAYGKARQDAASRWTATGRAESLFAAATLARKSGMEILGYEMSPDYRWLGGGYSLGKLEVKPGPFLETAEVRRQQGSEARPNQRYHYRWIAADLANHAADQLPRSSQAFAAVLCNAAGWVAGSDEEIRYYQRYVEQGPYVSWAANFGQQCQEPKFDEANKRYLTQPLNSVRSALRPYKALLPVAALVLLGGVAWRWVRRRKATR